jgi:N-acetylglucosamine-6-phosphate deacetylase
MNWGQIPQHSGFVDLQVNGFAGVNFSDERLTADQVSAVSTSLASRGTLAYCPTVITSSMAVYRRVLPLLADAISGPQGVCRLLGIHLEGPFISSQEGAVGAHPREHVRLPSIELFEELYSLAAGQIRILTLAPEQPGALALIRRAVDFGIAVSIGHTLASSAEIRAAVDAGARLSTHLGNGCPNLLHRHQNPIWPQMASPELSAMLITDGHHLPSDLITVFLAAKGPQRTIVTSDAAPAAGCDPGVYSFFGTRALLEPSGRLRNLERDTLAGSSASIFECMNHLASLNLMEEADLWRVGRDNALAALGLHNSGLPFGGLVRFEDGRFVLQKG